MRGALIAAVAALACGETSPVDEAAGDAAPAGSADAGSPGGPGEDAAEAHARADAATHALLLRFWRGGLGYLGATSPDPGAEPTGYWTFAQGMDAVLDAVERHQGRAFAGWIETLYRAQDARGWRSNFFDDENWMALALLRAHQLTGDPRYLERADALARDVIGAWDETCCGPRPGGVWWDRAHTQKATAANAGAALTAARMAMATGDGAWLADARRIYHYWKDEMVDPATHQVYDHIEPGGEVFTWRFTYNEGLMIGAALALHQATGEAAYLDDARAIAAALVSEQVTPSRFGDVLHDGGACSGDCRQFKGIAYRYLAALERTAPGDPQVRAVLDASAHALWEIARDPHSDTFGVDWAAPPDAGPVSLPQQSSAAMALGQHAALVGPAVGGPDGPLTWQAEDAILRGVGVEAEHGDFEGWGYVAGWNRDGQRVDLPVDVDRAGSYTLHIRYAAGGGDARRLLAIDGAAVAERLWFPATGGWDVYREVSAAVLLASGQSTVSLVHSGALGSAGYLNVDRISLEPAGSLTARRSRDRSR